MRNQMDDLHTKVLRKYHTLCSKLGLSEFEKDAIKESYGVESSADIDTHDLIDICNRLSKDIDHGASEKDKLRKRAMASIGGYLRATGQQEDADTIKGIACRATGYDSFNKIPVERLRNIACAFANKQKDIKAVDSIAFAMASVRMSEPGRRVVLN